MKTIPVRVAVSREFGPRKSIAALLFILLTVTGFSVLHSIAKPFWYDEICTVIVARLPGGSAIWKALDHAADGNPPYIYLVSRRSRQLIPDDHFGYRLPSILGLLVTVSCIYAILSKRVRRLSALVGATFVLCTALAAYAYEARPYSLLVACVALAIVAWQRIDDSRLYPLLLAIALAAAVSLHYYAIFVWPVFVSAEMSFWIFHRRFRIGAWASFLAGALPFFLIVGLLLRLRQCYGAHFWAHPSLKQDFLVFDWLFASGGHWGLPFVVGITLIFAYLTFAKKGTVSPAPQAAALNVLPIEEQTLILVLLWLPVIIVVATKVGHGGLSDRYMLPAVLGGALALGYLVDRVPVAARIFLLICFLMNYVSTSAILVGQALKGSLLQQRTAATHEAKGFIDQYDQTGLPIVISDGIRYLPMAYYTPADIRRNVYFVSDPPAALTFTDLHSDSVDLALLVLRRYFSLQVVDYTDFTSTHQEFLLVTDPGNLEWWPARLAHNRFGLRILSASGGTTIYKVTVTP
jgi:hypothetical protein